MSRNEKIIYMQEKKTAEKVDCQLQTIKRSRDIFNFFGKYFLSLDYLLDL